MIRFNSGLQSGKGSFFMGYPDGHYANAYAGVIGNGRYPQQDSIRK